MLITQLWGNSNDEALELLIDHAALLLLKPQHEDLWADREFVECLFRVEDDGGPKYTYWEAVRRVCIHILPLKITCFHIEFFIHRLRPLGMEGN